MKKRTKKEALKKEIFSFSRLIHVYLSTFLFSLLVLFAATGITLNHRWYDSKSNIESRSSHSISQSQLTQWSLEMDEKTESSSWNPDLTKITEYISHQFGLPLASDIEIDREYREILLNYKVPAGYATVTIAGSEKQIILEKEKGSFFGVINDLHKGRYSGISWSWLIDISAILMIIFSVTGLIILFQGKKYKKIGIISFCMGTITPYLVYLFSVPSFGA